MIFELRFYQVTRGRIADQNARIRRHLPALFAKHGVRCVGAWNTLAGPASPRFIYMFAFDDFAHREKAWAGFYADPDWATARAVTNAGHEMVERHDLYFLKSHAAWQRPATQEGVHSSGVLYELEMQQLLPGQAAGATQFIKDTYLPVLRESGARTAGVFDLVSGPGMQQAVMFHVWPDAQSWRRGRTAAESSQAMLDALAEQRERLGSPIFGRAEVNVMAPVDGVEIDEALGL
jgi:hypothetical protein